MRFAHRRLRRAARRTPGLVAEPGDADEAFVIRADGEVRPDQHLGDLHRRLGDERGGLRVGVDQRIAMSGGERREACHVGRDIAQTEQRLDGGPERSLDLCAALERSRRTGVGLGVRPSELERASLERRGLRSSSSRLGPGTTGTGRNHRHERGRERRGARGDRAGRRLSGLARKLGEELADAGPSGLGRAGHEGSIITGAARDRQPVKL